MSGTSKKTHTLPETNSKFAPENQWLPDDPFLLGFCTISRANDKLLVSGREQKTTSQRKNILHEWLMFADTLSWYISGGHEISPTQTRECHKQSTFLLLGGSLNQGAGESKLIQSKKIAK